jgi:hypothetical protein
MSLPSQPQRKLQPNVDEIQPRQILVLPQGDRRLYGEVIDVDQQRQRVWLRPLILVEEQTGSDREHPNQAATPTIHLLQDDSDLLWPLALFQPALDTELLPFWLELTQTPRPPLTPIAAQTFRQFIAQVWATHPALFRLP